MNNVIKKIIYSLAIVAVLSIFGIVYTKTTALAADVSLDELNLQLGEMNRDIAMMKTLINAERGKAAMAIKIDSTAQLEGQLKQMELEKAGLEKQIAQQQSIFSKEWVQRLWKWAQEKGASGAFWSAMKGALNKIAYDAGTWVGSGGKGQSAMFFKDGFGPYLTKIADETAGQFLENLGRSGPIKFNLCNPDFAVTMKIGLGLVQYNRPLAPACTFSKMKQNWEKELKDPHFLAKFQDMFNPVSNDIGIALSLQTNMIAQQNLKVGAAEKDRQESGGWLDVRSLISDKRESVPKYGELKLQQTLDVQTQNLGKYTGDAFVDAANIFLNQLAITLFQNLLGKIGKESGSSGDGSDSSGLFDQYAGPGSNGGIAAVKAKLRQVVEPKFDVRGDYNILSELTQCPDPTNAGPTNCVLDEKLRQGIEERVTVGEALTKGYLKGNGPFGFVTSKNLEPSYLEGYPYRSLIILRKFRILPVGWEVAAQRIKDDPALANGTRNLADLIACFDPSDEYTGYYQPWCEGLVDPNWVLKAPLNYCRRQGPGPQILSKTVSGSGQDSVLNITRNSNYCADEQSCIKENNDGSCQLYGYCTEERRKWKFGGESCEPLYNTCQTFKADNGSSASYLENTLDYSGCSVDNAGCLGYCANYDYATADYTCTPTSVGDKIFLDNGAEACDAKNEGCQEFVRAKIGLGANLLLNSSFEEDLSVGSWTGLSTATSTVAYDGQSSLNLPGGLRNKTVAVAPAGYDIGYTNGDVFTLSFYANGCAAGSTFKLDDSQPGVFDIATGTGWQYNRASFVVPQTVFGNQLILNFNAAGAGCLIDAIKLERGYRATAYNDYQNNEKVYEKILPGYLQTQCYDALGNLLPTAPAECGNFARMCRQEEVGCELFTATEDKMAVPAKVGAQNYCVPECVGFKSYLATETYFDSSRQENFIPKTAKSCSAAAVGCDEFTNLDKVAAGGEAVENYSYLRQCVQPAAPGAACSEFYTWEGSNESGFQLRVVSLDSITTAGTPDPRVTDPALDAGNCDATIYNLAPTDPAYNPDCREFYNTSGLKFYHLYSLTVSCSEDCHPYRRTEINIDASLGAGACVGADRNWGDHNGDSISECALCKNGGSWSAEHSACIYDAIPSQGRACQAAAAGCREYTGSTGRNIRVVLNNDFEDGTQQNWSGASLSNESIIVGGRSLLVSSASDEINKNVSTIVQRDKSYVISFIAKSNGATSLTARFENSAAVTASFGAVTGLSGEWQIYELNLARLDHEVDAGERLLITGSGGSGDFYIDNIKLTEIVNRYYLIKNSWETPAVCHADLSGNPAPDYMLGCEEYTDRDKQTHYLKSFAYLCSESAVGCEMLLDTNNSANPAAEDFNDIPLPPPASRSVDDVNVPADEFVYAVFDKKKQCNQDDKGCERLGRPYSYEGDTVYSDVYLKNNPDKYASIMCTLDGANCGEYSSADGRSYFKNPGDQACEWRQGYQAEWGWYKKKINRCDTDGDGSGDGKVCLKDGNCVSGQKCVMDNDDIDCAVDNYKTLGYGENLIAQPGEDVSGNNWVGFCPAEAAGCSEIVDPISQFSNNLIFNHDFSQGSGAVRYGWAGSSEQRLKLDPNTLYRFAGESNGGSNTITLTCPSPISTLDQNNNLIFSSSSISLAIDANLKSALFYSLNNNLCVIRINPLPSASDDTSVEIRKAVVAYQKKQKLDAQSCNGVVNFSDGCVLFNQRSQVGMNLSSLSYDADVNFDSNSSVTGPTAITPIDARVDSNKLLKVTPDRVCDKWLACKSQLEVKNEKGEKENSCLDIGLCNSVDANGNCDNFLSVERQNQSVVGTSLINGASINNLSGNTKVGSNPNDYYNYSVMTQDGNLAEVSNGNFELAGSDGYPFGWSAVNTAWKSTYFKIINNPYDTQKEGISQAPEGRGFLKAGISHAIASQPVDVSNTMDYIISFYYNTANLSEGNAVLNVVEADSNVNIIPGIALTAGSDWQLVNVPFTANSNKVKIIVSSVAGATKGNYYLDDIKISPALNYKNNSYAPQSCRLYPEDTSLSCNYIDNSGINKKGWLGYCLEYDRYPGSANACLSWWPVDRVNGNGMIDNGNFGGYGGKALPYYCAELDANFKIVEKRKENYLGQSKQSGYSGIFKIVLSAFSTSLGLGPVELLSGFKSNTANGINPDCPEDHGYYVRSVCNTSSGGFLGQKKTTTCNFYCTPKDPLVVNYTGSNWYEYNGSLIKFKNNDAEKEGGIRIYDLSLQKMYTPAEYSIRCNRFYQGSDALGRNKAWLGRVSEGTTYSTPVLNYTYETDDKPFGSAVPPNPISNPYEWDGSSLPGIQHLSIKSADSNQVRAGTPYSCAGAKCDKLGYCNVSKALCISQKPDNPAVDWLNPDPRETRTSVDYTDGTGFDIWQQTEFLGCPSGEFCDTALLNLNLATAPPPQESVKRLFAKNYGTWTWQGVTGVCANNEAISCTPDDNECTGGLCDSRCMLYFGDGLAPPTSATAIATSTNNGCDTTNPTICNANPIVNANFGLATVGAVNATNTCVTVAVACGAAPLYNNCCSAALDPLDCQTTYAAYDATPTNICNYTKNPCTSNADCQVATRCEASTCNGGVSAGLACSNPSACPGSQCTLNLSGVGRYQYTDPLANPTQYWDVPNTICPASGRPAYSADYCGIPPIVRDIKVNNAAFGTTIIINRNGLVNLTFNSVADRNQLPLVGYTVDWGDKEVSTVSGIESNDKQDPNNPHSFYHIYDYYTLRSKYDYDVARGVSSPIECPASNYCRVKPKINLKDNWGWCNEGTTGNLCTMTGPMTVFSTMSGTDHWEEYTAEIRVYEY